MRDFRHEQCMEVAKVRGLRAGASESPPRNLEALDEVYLGLYLVKRAYLDVRHIDGCPIYLGVST